MSITYTWKVTSVKVKNEGSYTDAVVQTYWEKIGTDEQGNTGKFSGATPFTTANTQPNQFVPYENLTEEIVLAWIQSAVTGDYELHVNGQIAKQIDEIINPVISKEKLPWEAASA